MTLNQRVTADNRRLTWVYGQILIKITVKLPKTPRFSSEIDQIAGLRLIFQPSQLQRTVSPALHAVTGDQSLKIKRGANFG